MLWQLVNGFGTRAAYYGTSKSLPELPTTQLDTKVGDTRFKTTEMCLVVIYNGGAATTMSGPRNLTIAQTKRIGGSRNIADLDKPKHS